MKIKQEFGSHSIISFFAGRKNELKLLASKIERRDKRIAFLVGPRGIGKTALAQIYANTNT